MNVPVDILFKHVWWRYRGDSDAAASVYHHFNLCEATVWFVLGILVTLRFWRFRNSSIEMVYAFAFFAFGASDLVEAWLLTSWLLWLKLIVLIALLAVRRHVIRRYYPSRSLY